jgi:hypothetical protein
VNFHSANGIRVRLHLRFGPTKDTQEKADKTFADRQKDFEEQRARAYQEAFVRAVRDRVKAAGEVRARNFDDLREEERHCLYRRLIDTLTHGGTAMADKHVAAELIRQVFDVDAMLYFVAPDWWDPAARRVATLGVSTPEVNPSGKTAELKPANLVEWGEHVSAIGDPYLVTEESRPAPLGASIGWVIELDGDPMRNAFLNAAWAKVVVPMRPGREREAIAWLRDQAEQDVGLKDSYQPQPGDPQEWAGKTLEDVLDALIGRIRGEQTTANTVDANVEALPGERVFQNGFDPLAGGVRFDAKELSVFDQWVEALATDQVVAVEYEKP